MTKLVLSFDPQGKGSCFYSEIVDLKTIGSLEVSRATTLEFNSTIQKWEVKTGETLLFSHTSRAVCLSWEQEHFNQ